MIIVLEGDTFIFIIIDGYVGYTVDFLIDFLTKSNDQITLKLMYLNDE